MSSPNKKATRLDTVTIYVLLREHCDTNSQGCAVYHPDWSDSRVAAETGVKQSIVAATRRDLFGRFPRTRRMATTPPREKIIYLENQITVLKDDFVYLEKRLNKLEDKLAIALPDYDPKSSASPLGLKHS